MMGYHLGLCLDSDSHNSQEIHLQMLGNKNLSIPLSRILDEMHILRKQLCRSEKHLGSNLEDLRDHAMLSECETLLDFHLGLCLDLQSHNNQETLL